MSDTAQVKLTKEVITKNFAEVVVNGQSKGKREINGHPSLREFCEGLAEEFGIKTFTVSVDKSPVTSSAQAEAPVQAGQSVGLHTKDSRGIAKKAKAETDTGDAPALASEGEQTQEMHAAEPGAAEQTAGESTPSSNEGASEQATEQAASEPTTEQPAEQIKEP